MAQILTTGEEVDFSLCHGLKVARVPAPRSPGARGVTDIKDQLLVVFAPPMFTSDIVLHHI
jgi:hypothetical protein